MEKFNIPQSNVVNDIICSVVILLVIILFLPKGLKIILWIEEKVLDCVTNLANKEISKKRKIRFK